MFAEYNSHILQNTVAPTVLIDRRSGRWFDGFICQNLMITGNVGWEMVTCDGYTPLRSSDLAFYVRIHHGILVWPCLAYGNRDAFGTFCWYKDPS